MNNFDEIENKYKKLIEDNNLDVALKFLSNEMNSNFIPSPYYEKWIDEINILKKQILYKQEKNKKNEFIKKLQISDLMKYITNNNEIDFYFLNIYYNKFKTLTNPDQIQIFQLLLKSDYIGQEDKFKLFSFLIANTNTFIEYEFHNSELNKNLIINKDVLNILNNNNNINKNIANKIANKNITYFNLAMQIINLCYMYCFPFKVNEIWNLTNELFIQKVFRYIKNSFESQNYNDKEINKIIKYFN